eukprot:COSAG01_NODE_15307_length_1351_cov_11.189297_1_plen_260_part_00
MSDSDDDSADEMRELLARQRADKEVPTATVLAPASELKRRHGGPSPPAGRAHKRVRPEAPTSVCDGPRVAPLLPPKPAATSPLQEEEEAAAAPVGTASAPAEEKSWLVADAAGWLQRSQLTTPHKKDLGRFKEALGKELPPSIKLHLNDWRVLATACKESQLASCASRLCPTDDLLSVSTWARVYQLHTAKARKLASLINKLRSGFGLPAASAKTEGLRVSRLSWLCCALLCALRPHHSAHARVCGIRRQDNSSSGRLQ